MLVKPLVRSIVRSIAGVPTNSLGSGFSPTSLFADGSKGVVYDNNDLSSFYLDSIGTTQATVNGLVGLQLDKSGGLALGAELVTNGDFSGGTTGWTAFTSTLSESGGVLRITENGVATAGYARQSFTVTANRWHKITVDVSNITATKTQVWVGTSYGAANWALVDNITSPRTVTAYFYATTATLFLELVISVNAGGTTEYAEFDNVSVKELPGNHRYQTTTGSKPVLRGTPTGANLVTNGDFASGTGWTAGSGWAIGSGVATATASSGTLTSALTATASKVYRLTYTITASAGSIQPSFGGVTGASRTAAGTYVEYLTASSTAALVFTGTTFSGTVDNIEVMDVSAGSVTAPYGLQYDGVDDFMQTAAVDFTATDKMFVCAGVRKLSDAGISVLAELSPVIDTNNGSFVVYAPVGATPSYSVGSKGSTARVLASINSGYPAPITNVIAGIFDISGDICTNRINGGVVTTNATDQGTGNFGNYAMYFGRRAGTSLPYNGLDFGLVICGKTLTSTQISSTERYIAQRTGIAL